MPVLGSTAYSTALVISNLVRACLNDYGLSPAMTISAISRAGNTVTVTTATPHGLLAGGAVTILGVADSSYNGVFTVALVQSALIFTFTQAGGNSSSSGGTSAGVGSTFTDVVLLPYINSAYRKVQRSLAMAGQTTFLSDDNLVVITALPAVDPGAQVAFTDSTTPQLPLDLIVPLKLWERRNGTNDDFVEMADTTETGGLPSRAQGQMLQQWEWRADGIYFVGALQDVQIRLRYEKLMPDLVDMTSGVLVRSAQDAIGYLAAGLASLPRGSQDAAKWDAAGMDGLENLIAAAVRQQQRVPRRRRPYSARPAGGGRWL